MTGQLQAMRSEIASRFPEAAPNGVQSCPDCHWIGLVLRDRSGNLQAREPYILRGPGGRALRGRLDGSGTARVDGVASGTWEVSFPGLADGVWRRV